MGTVPTNYTWVNGEQPNFRDMNSRLSDVVNFLLHPPMVRLRRTTAFNIPNTTATAIPWDFVEYESADNMWDSTAPTKIKPSVPGWYIGSAGVSYNPSANGYREIDIRKNGSTTNIPLRIKTDTSITAGASWTSRGHMFLEFFNGTTDYVELTAWQNSGGTLGISVLGPEQYPDFSMRWFNA